MSHRDEDLPVWVEILMNEAEAAGYERGFEDGQKQLWYKIQDDMKTRKPYGA